MKKAKTILIILIAIILILVGILSVFRSRLVIPLTVSAESYVVINNQGGAMYEINNQNDIKKLNEMLSGKFRLKTHSESFNLVDNPCKYTVLAKYTETGKDTLTKNFATYPEVDANNKTVYYGEAIHIIDNQTISIWNENKNAFWIGNTNKKIDTSFIEKLMTKDNETFSGSF